MTNLRLKFTIMFGLVLILSTGFIQSQGPAIVTKDPDAACTLTWVDVSGNSFPALPGGEGLVAVFLENVIVVETNSRNGNLNLSCKGRLPYGDDVLAIDVVTGLPVLATLATIEEACDAACDVFPGVRRGKGGAVFSFENTGNFCFVNGVPTTDWLQVNTPGGPALLSCHVTQ